MFLRILTVLAVAFAGAVHAESDGSLRKLMTADEAKAWQAVGRVDMASGGFCTGALVAPNLVLTAAHCVFNPETGEKMAAEELGFAAGWRQGRAAAYRSARRVVVHPAYDAVGGKSIENVGNDIALIELDHAIRNTAIMPFDRTVRPDAGSPVQVVSYAADRSEMPSIEEHCEILGQNDGVLVMSCNANFGASGSPVFVMENGYPKIASVVSAKATWKQEEVSLGTSLGAPLEQLMAALKQDKSVFKSKRVSTKSLNEQLGRNTSFNFSD